ncbi:MAG TPA: hypothetical protein VMU06_08765 [Stellaceae bacterium]|nr:hypothetical protein [Stellaceae bacterium]
MTSPADIGDELALADPRLSVHEAVCAERYANILAMLQDTARRVSRLEILVISAAGTVILGMASLLVTLALKLGHSG